MPTAMMVVYSLFYTFVTSRGPPHFRFLCSFFFVSFFLLVSFLLFFFFRHFLTRASPASPSSLLGKVASGKRSCHLPSRRGVLSWSERARVLGNQTTGARGNDSHGHVTAFFGSCFGRTRGSRTRCGLSRCVFSLSLSLSLSHSHSLLFLSSFFSFVARYWVMLHSCMACWERRESGAATPDSGSVAADGLAELDECRYVGATWRPYAYDVVLTGLLH